MFGNYFKPQYLKHSKANHYYPASIARLNYFCDNQLFYKLHNNTILLKKTHFKLEQIKPTQK